MTIPLQITIEMHSENFCGRGQYNIHIIVDIFIQQLRNTKFSKITNLFAEILTELGNCQIQNKTVKVAWIKSHIGIEGNEIADLIAKEACTDGIENICKIPASDFTRQIRNKAKIKFNSNFTSNEKGKFYKSYQQNIPNSAWFLHPKQEMHKNFVRTICRLRSGHCLTKSYKHKIKLVDSPLCDNCGDEETLQHILLECKQYTEERISLFNELYKTKNVVYPFNLEHLLSLNCISIYSHLYKFFKDVNVNI